MMETRVQTRRLVTMFAVAATLLVSGAALGESGTKVFLNGTPTPVYFNDGDSFRVMAGPMAGTRARLKGFNTLESYGRCHQWGTWTRLELSHFATLGTMNARQGVWHCTSDMEKDYYGRILWDCKDLAVDQVRKGLAHAMSVTKDAADPTLLAAQRYAIKRRLGMWAHGVPDFVMTSVHSKSEGWSAYNRLISSADGHSKKWQHGMHYDHCQMTCEPVPDLDPRAVVEWVKKTLLSAPGKSLFEGYSEAKVVKLLTDLGTIGKAGGLLDESKRYAIEALLSRAISTGELAVSGKPTSCMIYVEFKRRYGRAKASCLK